MGPFWIHLRFPPSYASHRIGCVVHPLRAMTYALMPRMRKGGRDPVMTCQNLAQGIRSGGPPFPFGGPGVHS